MKAISLWQPWASAIALGHKRIETRHWSTSYRGPIAIHAAKRWTRDERDYADAFAHFMPMPHGYPLGSIVATATLYDVRRTEVLAPMISAREDQLGNYSPERFGWLLGDIQALAIPIPFLGRQGLFDIPDDLIARPTTN